MLFKLINNPSEPQKIYLPLICHITGHLDTFIFNQNVSEKNIPLDYFESEDINAKKNIHIKDCSGSIADNQLLVLDEKRLPKYFSALPLPGGFFHCYQQ